MPKRKPGELLPKERLLLKSLHAGPNHGLGLAKLNDLHVSTVYKALERLEAMALVRSRWEYPRPAAAARPRRVFKLTAKGRQTAGE